MSLIEELERMVDQRVDQRINDLEKKKKHLKPWVKMNIAASELEKDPRWIREKLCTLEFQDKGLVKKVGGEWHFLNPEFFQYVHDVWWPLYEGG